MGAAPIPLSAGRAGESVTTLSGENRALGDDMESWTEVAAVVKCRVISGGEVTVVGEAKWRRPTKKQWGRTKEKLAAIQQNVHEHEAQMRNY